MACFWTNRLNTIEDCSSAPAPTPPQWRPLFSLTTPPPALDTYYLTQMPQVATDAAGARTTAPIETFLFTPPGKTPGTGYDFARPSISMELPTLDLSGFPPPVDGFFIPIVVRGLLRTTSPIAYPFSTIMSGSTGGNSATYTPEGQDGIWYLWRLEDVGSFLYDAEFGATSLSFEYVISQGYSQIGTDFEFDLTFEVFV